MTAMFILPYILPLLSHESPAAKVMGLQSRRNNSRHPYFARHKERDHRHRKNIRMTAVIILVIIIILFLGLHTTYYFSQRSFLAHVLGK